MLHDRKSILKITKGFYGRAKNCYRIARQRGEKALRYQYVGRKLKKRNYRQLWIQRINAAVRQFALPYNTFINATQHYNVQCKLDRKMLSELAVNEPNSFKAVVDTVKEHGEVPEKRYHLNGHVQSALVYSYVQTSAAQIAKKLIAAKGEQNVVPIR